MRVLVIDDDIAYRNAISIAAKNRKWQPIACKDIETAKQIIQSESLDLIISDCLLYDETVIDLLHWMTTQNIDIPVIVVSASDDESLSDTAIKCGARNFYDKLGFNLSKIYGELEKWKV